MNLQDLLNQAPLDTEQRVKNTKETLSRTIREILRQETGFRLDRLGAGGADVIGRQARREGVIVRIEIEPCLPSSLQTREIDPHQQLAARLALLTPWLRQLHESARTLEPSLGEISPQAELQNLTRGREKSLPQISKLAEELLDLASSFDFVQWLHEVDDDVLGAYFSGANGGMIELYWGVIGLTAMALEVRVEDLTAVVLAHELAHAYTHLGMDKDGQRWNVEWFQRSERELKEGLAQYYTAIVCPYLEPYAPGAYNAYKKLLEHQPKPYQVHLPWLESFKLEEVRHALLKARRHNLKHVADFNDELELAQSMLRP
jgi:hypothetical protein